MEVKTKKLKKLWSKYQTAHREVKDIQEEFQQERSDMLDTIRELTRQLKLKEVGAHGLEHTHEGAATLHFHFRNCSNIWLEFRKPGHQEVKETVELGVETACAPRKH